jgi:hypothetical protein
LESSGGALSDGADSFSIQPFSEEKLWSGFVRGLINLKSFGNLNLLVPGLEVLDTLENPIKSHGYWHFGHGDFIFQSQMFI